MSYNIDTFKVKKLENLSIPFADLMANEYCNRTNEDDGSITLCYGEACEVKGYLVGDMVNVKSIDWSGEGSGNDMHDTLEPALKNSIGEFVASCVWEGGDSINQLVVNDGNVAWNDIDI